MKIKIKDLEDGFYRNSSDISKGLISITHYYYLDYYVSLDDVFGESPVKILLPGCDITSPDNYPALGERFKESDIFEYFNIDGYGCHENVVILPVYIYSHSGETISTTPFGDPWDSWLCGCAFIEKRDIDDLGITLEEAKEMINERVDEFDQILTGSIMVLDEITVTLNADGSILDKVCEDTRWIYQSDTEEEIEVEDDCCYDSIYEAILKAK